MVYILPAQGTTQYSQNVNNQCCPPSCFRNFHVTPIPPAINKYSNYFSDLLRNTNFQLHWRHQTHTRNRQYSEPLSENVVTSVTLMVPVPRSLRCVLTAPSSSIHWRRKVVNNGSVENWGSPKTRFATSPLRPRQKTPCRWLINVYLQPPWGWPQTSNCTPR